MDAIARLPDDQLVLLAELASHSAASAAAKLQKFAADQMPEGRNTRPEVEKQIGPAANTVTSRTIQTRVVVRHQRPIKPG
jgi:hypothetical protein